MEAPEPKTLFVIISFLALFGILVGTIPSDFVFSTEEYREISVPDYFEAIDITQYAQTYQHNITHPTYAKLWGKSEFGHDMRFADDWVDLYRLTNTHGYTFLGIWTGGHYQEWVNKEGVNRGEYLSLSELEEDWGIGTQSDKGEYTLQCKHFHMDAWFAYNTTTYSSIKDAWDNDELKCLFGIEWDEMGTGLDAWNLIRMILFWQLPDINLVLNVIISIPLWIGISWMIFAFVLAVIKSLPFT